jgi:hypothetical protein
VAEATLVGKPMTSKVGNIINPYFVKIILITAPKPISPDISEEKNPAIKIPKNLRKGVNFLSSGSKLH